MKRMLHGIKDLQKFFGVPVGLQGDHHTATHVHIE